MPALDIFQSHSLARLARHWFDFIGQTPLGDPFAREIVIVGSRTMHGWLQQEFLFNHRGRQRVLANWDLQYLNVFVNDCLGAMSLSRSLVRVSRGFIRSPRNRSPGGSSGFCAICPVMQYMILCGIIALAGPPALIRAGPFPWPASLAGCLTNTSFTVHACSPGGTRAGDCPGLPQG